MDFIPGSLEAIMSDAMAAKQGAAPAPAPVAQQQGQQDTKSTPSYLTTPSTSDPQLQALMKKDQNDPAVKAAIARR